MEVDNRNFEEALPLCLKAVEEADFVGLDLEMTGITLPDSRITLGDSPESAYRKMKAVAERFNIVQVGVCPMVKQPPSSSSGVSSSSSVYVSTPFTFYIFPRPVRYGSLYHNELVTLCADATNFHRKNGLDFGRWMKDGISYVNAEMEEKARQRAVSGEAEEAGGEVKLLTCPSANAMEPQLGLDKLTSTDQKESVENSLKQLREAIANTGAQKTEGGSVVANGLAAGDQNAQQLGEEDSELDRHRLVSFPVLSQLTAEVLVSCIWSEFGDSVVLREARLNRGYRRKLEAFKASPETNSRLKMREVERKERALRGLVGFRIVWSKLVAAQKLTVLHNGLFDLLFLFAAFEGPLPNTLAELKTLKQRLLPHTIDTKAISTLLPNRFRKGTSLEEVAANIQAAESTVVCNFKFPVGFIDYDANAKGSPPEAIENGQPAKVPKTQVSGKQEGPKTSNAEGKEAVAPLTKTTALPPSPATSFHNAGYDAYQTARTFAALCADGELKRELFEEALNKYLLGRCIKLVNFNVNKSTAAVSSSPPPQAAPACGSPAGLDFQADELICGKDGFVLWLGDFPKNYTVEELHNILGSQELEEAVRRWGSVAIRWIDDNSVFLVGFKGGQEYRGQLERYLHLKESREGNFKCKLPDEVFQELDKTLHQRLAASTS